MSFKEFLICLTLSCVIEAVLVGWLIQKDYRKLSVEYGCGQYSSTTGEFEWKEKETPFLVEQDYLETKHRESKSPLLNDPTTRGTGKCMGTDPATCIWEVE